MKPFLGLVLLLLFSCLSFCQLTKLYDNCVVIDQDNDIMLLWTVDFDTNIISIGMQGSFGGYLALGFSQDGSMTGGSAGFADAWVADSRGSLYDYYLPDYNMPRPDQEQDFTSPKVSFKNGVITAEWSRPLNTGDSNDYPIDMQNPMTVIWAGHPTSPLSGTRMQKHQVDGSQQMHFGYRSTCPGVPVAPPAGSPVTPPASNPVSSPPPVATPPASKPVPPPPSPVTPPTPVSPSTPTTTTALASPGKWTNFVSDDQTFQFQFQIIGNWLHVNMTAPTTGWISIGFNNIPSMKNADTYTAWVSNGALISKDEWSVSLSQPRADVKLGGSNDMNIVSFGENSRSTYVYFRRPLVTNDQWDFSLTPTTQCVIIWAWCVKDGNADGSYPIHSDYGTLQVDFSTIPVQPDPTSTPAPAKAPSTTTVLPPPAAPVPNPAIPSPTSGIDSTWTQLWSDNKDFHFAFKVGNNIISILMEAQTTGWISIGFNKNNSMRNMDSYTGWVTNSGDIILRDEWSPRKRLPALDSSLSGGLSSANLENAGEANGWTSIRFSRALDTGDKWDYPITPASNTYYVLWAYAPTDGNDAGTNYTIHSERGSWHVSFSPAGETPTIIPPPVIPPATQDPALGSNWTEHYWSETKDFHFAYKVVGTDLHVLMQGFTTGWISIGLGLKPSMSASDTYTCWISSNNVIFRDEWSANKKQPVLDDSLGGTRDGSIVHAEETGGWTSAYFIRPLSTGDTWDYQISATHPTYYVLWAKGPDDGSADGTTYPIHDETGHWNVNFLGIPGGGPSEPSGSLPLIGFPPNLPSSNWHLFWSADKTFNFRYAITNSTLHVIIEAQTTGWVSFGLNTNPKMRSADTYTGWITDSGKVIFRDEWSASMSQPVLDTSLNGTSDVTVVNATQRDGWTAFYITRPLNTGDKRDYPITPTQMQYSVIWATCKSDGSEDGDTYPIHDATGSISVSFLIPSGTGVTSDSGLPLSATSVNPTNSGDSNSTEWGAVTSARMGEWSGFMTNGGAFSFQFKQVGDDLHVMMKAQTTGWISIGLGKTPFMPASDTYTGWITKSGQSIFREEWSADRNQPVLDTALGGTSDAIVINSSESNGWTQFYFIRPLNTGDKYDYAITPGNTQYYILWAYALDDGDDRGITYGMHDYDGSQLLDFSAPGKILRSENYLLGVEIDISPGFTLLLLVGSILIIWASVHWTKILIKRMLRNPNRGVSAAGRRVIAANTTPFFATDENAGDSTEWTKDPACPTDPAATYYNADGTENDNIGPPDQPPRGLVRSPGYYRGSSFVSGAEDQSYGKSSTSLVNVSDPDGSDGSGHGLLKQVAVKQDKGTANEQELKDVAAAPVTDSAGQYDLTARPKEVCCGACYGYWYTRIHGQHIAVGDILILVVYLALNVLSAFLFQDLTKLLTTNGLLHAAGSLVAANCVITVITATRNSILVYLVGIPFDRTIMYHRWLGVWVIILAFLHAIAIIWDTYVMNGKFSVDMVLRFIRNTPPETNLWGTIALGVVTAMILCSVEIIRRRKFEIFLYAHYVLAICFFTFSALHMTEFVPFAIISAAFYAFDVLLRILWGGLPRKTVLLETKPGGLIHVRFPKPFPWLHNFKVAQYVFLNFPQVNLHEWHPFSICSAPSEGEIEVMIKSLGNWTKRLYKIAEKHDQLWVRMDGPYGNLNLNYTRYSKILLVGGGIGITPILGILKAIYYSQKKTPMKVVTAVLTVRNITELNWFSEQFEELKARASSNKKAPYFDLQVHVTRPEPDEEQLPLMPGVSFQRPQLEQVFDRLAKAQPKGAKPSPDSATPPCFVFVCGPRKIVNQCWDLSRKHTLKGSVFHFHHETFEF